MVRSPVEICLGTRPSQAAKSRPLENTSPAPIAATTALEMMGPILGTLISRSQPASRRAMAWRPDHVGRRDARGRARESRLRCQAAIRIHREAFADVAGCTHLFGPPA